MPASNMRRSAVSTRFQRGYPRLRRFTEPMFAPQSVEISLPMSQRM